jgi:hypothetical protein
MHIEKNVCAALLKTFSNCKGTRSDGIKVHRAMQELNWVGMEQYWPDGEANYQDAPWVWTTAEWDEIIDDISNIQTPTGYGSSLRYKFNDRKLVGFKTHDYHNLLHDILSIAVWGTLTSEVQDIVYQLDKSGTLCRIQNLHVH